MAKIPELTADMEVIQKLGRRPNTDDGLTEAGFKAKFDEAGIAIKKFINEKVVPAINDYVVSTDGLLDRSGGTMSGNIAMGGNRVTGLGTPTDDGDAAPKSYVDAAKTDAVAAAKTYTDGRRFTATATLSTTWSGSAAPYTQTVTVSGILASDTPHVAPVYSATLATALAQKEAWAKVSNAESAAGGIKFTCFEEKPTTAIPIQIEVMR